MWELKKGFDKNNAPQKMSLEDMRAEGYEI